MSEDYYTSTNYDFLRTKQGDDAYWDERIRRQNLARMTPEQRRNNPQAKPMGHFTGRCGHCGSSDLWDDNLAYGCNSCGRFLAGN